MSYLPTSDAGARFLHMTNHGQPAKPWSTVDELAADLGLHPRSIRHRIKAGTIRATKLGAGVTSPYVIETAEAERLKAEASK